MNHNEFATYVASLNGAIDARNNRLATIRSMVETAVATTIKRDVEGKLVTIPSASLLLENGETIILPMSTVGRTTGRNIGDDDLYLLEEAKVIYFVANAEEGQEFAFRPNAQPVQANTTNLLTTVHALRPHKDSREDLRQLPAFHIDIDTTNGGDFGEGGTQGSGKPAGTLADQVAQATDVATLKALLSDAAFEGIDDKVANMRSVDNMRDAMLAHIA